MTLFNSPLVKRDLNWLRQALQTAIELEASTLPLYFSALYSLKVQNYTAYNIIRSVAMEEMVHMAIAANILAAIGGTPRIKTINTPFPTRGLPGGVEPDLNVGLAKLSRKQIWNFMRIETPDILLRKMDRDECYPTISVFYNVISKAIVDNANDVRDAFNAGGKSNQVYDDIGFSQYTKVEGKDPIDMLLGGIAEIIEQGEGASSDSLFTPNDFELEESHYCRFAELYYGAAYEAPTPQMELNHKTKHLFFGGPAIGWPEVINTLAVPSDGYAKILHVDPEGAAVTKDLEAFDSAYAVTLANLDLAWNGPVASSWKTVGLAVRGVGGNPPGMIDLRVLGRENIMRHQVPQQAIAELPTLYPTELEYLNRYTDLNAPVFYGPRFINANEV
jgi:hypothetical protein